MKKKKPRTKRQNKTARTKAAHTLLLEEMMRVRKDWNLEKRAFISRVERIEDDFNRINQFIAGNGPRVLTGLRLAYVASQPRYAGLSPKTAASESIKMWKACHEVVKTVVFEP